MAAYLKTQECQHNLYAIYVERNRNSINKLEQLEFKLIKMIGIWEYAGKKYWTRFCSIETP